MKKIVLALLLAFIIEHMPWRLLVLAVEVFVLSPAPTRISMDDSHYWDALTLEGRLIHLGWAVSYKKDLMMNGRRAYGITMPDERRIFVDADLHWTARHTVLAHEAGHTMQPNWIDSRGQAEAFAESVAYLLSHDGVREHARYLSAHRAEFLFMVLTEWPTMYRMASMFED